MATVTVPNIDPNIDPNPYPVARLPFGGTALALFAAAYLGANDAIHFARKQMTATCVDTDDVRLDLMRSLYPPDWEFVAVDAWAFAAFANHQRQTWDVVSVDTFTGEASARSMESLPLWCSLAKRAVTVTVGRDDEVAEIPEGWLASRYKRSARASWLVLSHA